MPSGIKLSLYGFDVDIGEFVRLIRDLAGAKLDAQSKDALKTMIAEVGKSFDVVLDVVTPLYALNTEPMLETKHPRHSRCVSKTDRDRGNMGQRRLHAGQ